jgi:hypothetical protein
MDESPESNIGASFRNQLEVMPGDGGASEIHGRHRSAHPCHPYPFGDHRIAR